MVAVFPGDGNVNVRLTLRDSEEANMLTKQQAADKRASRCLFELPGVYREVTDGVWSP